MTNIKWTQLPTVTDATVDDIICAIQSGVSTQQTLSQVLALVQSNLIKYYSGNPNGFLAGSTYQLCWDTTNEVLYVCTFTGTSSTSVWTLVQASSEEENFFTVTSNTQMENDSFYRTNSPSVITLTLPTTSSVGQKIGIIGYGSGGWQIAQNSGQNIIVGTNGQTTTGVSGTVASKNRYCSLELICTVANTSWQTIDGSQGNLLINGSTTTNSLDNDISSCSGLPITGLSPAANSSMMVTNSSGTPSMTASMTNGQVVIGSTSGTPAPATLTAGSNVTITNAANSITIAAAGSGTVNSGTINQMAYYASTGTAVSGLSTANSGVLVTSSGGVPSISSTLPSGLALQTPASVTLTNATGLPVSTGLTGTGTGVTAALAANVTGSGGIVLATSPTLVTPALGTPSSGVLTNCTGLPSSSITGLGTGVATALTQAVTGSGGIVLATSPSLTTPNLGTPSAVTLTNGTGLPLSTGVTGQLPLTNGGTNASLTASNGGVFYSTGSAGAILAGTATAGQILRSGSSAAPSWSTATYPATTTISQLLYSSSANTVAGLSTTNSAALVTTSAGVPGFTSTMTNGQVVIGSTGGTPTAAALTQGTGITITNGAGSITIAATSTASGTVNSGTANQLAYYASSGTAVSGLTGANSATLVTNSSGVPAMTASMTNGQVLIGSTGATPTPATLTAGTGVSINNTAGGITISASGGGVGWNSVGGTSQTMSSNSGYVVTSSSLTTLTLPASSSFGDVLYIQGFGSGGWTIAQGASQQIIVGSNSTTAGVGGSLASQNRYDSISLVCVTANTTWISLGAPQGTLTTA